MKVEYVFSTEVAACEVPEDIHPEKTVPDEGKLISEAKLYEYYQVAEDILAKAEAYFPEFAKDTGTTVNLFLVGNEMIRKINKEEREVDAATDVLSFPFLELKEGDGSFSVYDLNPENGAIMLGDLVVSVEKVAEQALEYGHSERRELAFLLTHGFLHLMGYDHIAKKDEDVMLPLSEKILNESGYERI